MAGNAGWPKPHVQEAVSISSRATAHPFRQLPLPPMSFFVVPTFVPPTLEQLTREPDEVAIIVSQEARIAHEVRLHCNQASGVR